MRGCAAGTTRSAAESGVCGGGAARRARGPQWPRTARKKAMPTMGPIMTRNAKYRLDHLGGDPGVVCVCGVVCVFVCVFGGAKLKRLAASLIRDAEAPS